MVFKNGDVMKSQTQQSNEESKTSSLHKKHQESTDVLSDLKKTLADEYVLQLKTQNAHWNVEGPNFFSLHKLFEEQYDSLSKFVDRCAESIRTLKTRSPASFKEFKDLSSLSDFAGSDLSWAEYVEVLSGDHTNLSLALKARREEADDNDEISIVVLYEDLIEFHDKAAWMIRSHNKK